MTVFNSDRRRGAKLISEIGFRKIRGIHEKRMGYRAYLGEVARHKIIFQLDRSRVPGRWQVMPSSAAPSASAAMARLSGSRSRKRAAKTGDAELIEIAQRLLTNENERRAVAERATKIAKEKAFLSRGSRNSRAFLCEM